MSRQKIKMARKMKGKILLKRKIKALERENTIRPWMNQILIVTKIHHQRTHIDNGSSSESSKEEMFQDKHTSSRFSTKSSEKKNKWKFSKQLKNWSKAKFLKHISDQEIKESILE